MPTPRGADDHTARLEREVRRLRIEYRRVCEEIDWRDEQIRVLRRVVERLVASERE